MRRRSPAPKGSEKGITRSISPPSTESAPRGPHLLIAAGPFHGEEETADAHKEAQLQEHAQLATARRHQVKPLAVATVAPGILSAGVQRLHAGETQRLCQVLQKVELLARAVEEGERHLRGVYLQHHPGKPGARADIERAHPLAGRDGEEAGEGIEDVLDGDPRASVTAVSSCAGSNRELAHIRGVVLQLPGPQRDAQTPRPRGSTPPPGDPAKLHRTLALLLCQSRSSPLSL